MSPVVVVFMTYARTEYARRTAQGLRQHLQYGGPVTFYLADDGSPAEHVAAVREAIGEAQLIGGHSERQGYGASANKAWHVAHEHADITLFLEDDWELQRPLDIAPYVQALEQERELGMIRLGYLPVGLDCHTVGYQGRHYLDIKPSTQYMFSGNPALRHRRFREEYGPYPEGLNPGQTEIAYDAQVRHKANGQIKIVWPVDLGGWGVFAHIGTEKSYKPPQG